jgi:DEAD/DEAH box helicase domain-containing protein
LEISTVGLSLELAGNLMVCRARALMAGSPGSLGQASQCTFMKNTLYLDLETQKSAGEVGGWGNVRDMRMSVGVTYSTARNEYRIYGEKQVDDLVRDLQRADLVVGFNNLRFDYEVLHYYTVLDLRQIPTLDVLVELQKRLTHRLSLDAVASATFGVEKTAEGMQAIQWFRQGRLVDIAQYCCYDVKITRMVHEYGAAHRRLFYKDRIGNRLTVPVAW